MRRHTQIRAIVVIVAFVCGSSWTSRPNGEECVNYENTVVGSRPRSRFMDVVGILKGVMLDNSPTGKRLRAREIRYLMREDSNSSWRNIGKTGKDVGHKWKDGGEVKVVIHGLTPWLDKSADEKLINSQMVDIYDAYQLKDDSLNVIMVDWSQLSSYTPTLYWQAVDSVRFAADEVTEFICHLKLMGLISAYDQIHIIGFSLGAHVAEATGQRISIRTGQKIKRITGLDPAGPLFTTNGFGGLPINRINIVDKSDAEFVDIIHCNMAETLAIFRHEMGSGTNARSGHVDFYPNGGRTQSGCSAMENDDGCSHYACSHLFVESIKEDILSCRCKTWLRFMSGLCACTKWSSRGVWFGDRVNFTARGKYYLRI